MMTLSYAYWRTGRGYAFWLRDGAVADFRHSGGAKLWSFLLEDMQGAVFFHPFLSLAIGVLSGLIAGAAVLAVRTLIGDP